MDFDHGAFIDLLQHAALICYCSALLNLAPVGDIMQSVVLYLFLDIDHHLTMHIWSFLWPFSHMLMH